MILHARSVCGVRAEGDALIHFWPDALARANALELQLSKLLVEKLQADRQSVVGEKDG